MLEVWPTTYVAELRLAASYETEMSTALQTQSCERALLTTGVLPTYAFHLDYTLYVQ